MISHSDGNFALSKSRITRWLEALQNYDIEIYKGPSENMMTADGLSRILENCNTEVINKDAYINKVTQLIQSSKITVQEEQAKDISLNNLKRRLNNQFLE